MWAGLKGVSTYGLLPPILLAYFLLSCLCAAALLSTIDRLTWKQTWILGGGMAFPIVPLASVLGGTLLSSMVKSRRSRRQRSMSYETTPPMPWGFAAALLWLTALVLAGVISAVWTFSEQAKAFVRSRDRYACVEGTILSAGVGQTPRGTSGESFFYWPDIKYHYVVDGTDYWSSRFSDTGSYFTTRPPAYKLAMQHAPPGLRVKVYFDPKDPSKAVLDRSLPKANLMLLLALQPPALSCIVLLGSVLYMPIHRRNMRKYLRGDLNPTCRVPTWGLWRIEEEGLLAMEPIGRRLPGTLIAYCFTCLIMLLVGAIAGRSDWFIPKALVYSTIACVCAGMLGWILAGGSRPNRLEIDPRHHTIRLMGKHQDMELAFSELARFTIEPQGIWATLKLVTTGGSEITLHEFRPAWPLTPSLAIARKIATAFASTTGGEVDVCGAEKTKRSPTVA